MALIAALNDVLVAPKRIKMIGDASVAAS